MIDKDMMEEVLRWMSDREEPEDEDEQAELAAESIRDACIDPEAMAYYMDVIPEDIMRSAAMRYGRKEEPQNVVKVAMSALFTVAFEAGSRCRALDMERNG